MQVTIRDGNKELRTVNLESFGKDVVSFGRHPESDIVLTSGTVSRVHGCFYLEEGLWHIKDLDSTNGIYLDGIKADEKCLYDGMEITITNNMKQDEIVRILFQETPPETKQRNIKKPLLVFAIVIAFVGIIGLIVGFVIPNSETTNEKYISDTGDSSNKDAENTENAHDTEVMSDEYSMDIDEQEDNISPERKAYYKFLSNIATSAFDESSNYVACRDDNSDIYYYNFAIEDFDGDDKEELLIYSDSWQIDSYMAGAYYGAHVMFYEYNVTKNEVQLTNSTYASLTKNEVFYDNGIVQADYYYYGVADDYINTLGILPDVDSNGNLVENFDGSLGINERYGGGYAIYFYESGGAIEFKQITAEEYDELTAKLTSGNIIDVCFYDFNIENIAMLNGEDSYTYEFAIYGEEGKVESLLPDEIYVNTTFEFGHYEQDNDLSNGKEPIVWKVLANNGNRILVVSQVALDAKPYNETDEAVTWETCTLRMWLNNEFINEAFNDDELSYIEEIKLENLGNYYYNVPDQNVTVDRVFLLSIDEVERYMPAFTDRICRYTLYAEKQTMPYSVYSEYDACWWWLRTGGELSNFATYIYRGEEMVGGVYRAESGEIDVFGDHVDSDKKYVRPAMWITVK